MRTGDTPSRGRVLAVDDDEGVLGMLARVLSSEGFQVDRARSASETLDAVRRHPRT